MSVADLTTALSDRYRIDRELGAGGMATVYLAHDLKHDRDVAIKVLHPDLGAALGADRFLSEIKTTAKLQHPHILPLLDSGEAAGLLYYVMPLATGETLRDRLAREQQLPIDDALRIAGEVADALYYAHSTGTIHRDIKPENILLQGGHALVADFGIALAVEQSGGQRMTQTGLSLGTPQYMSPEQAMGEKRIDPRSDIYSLGAVTYEMLTGEPPFTGASVQAIVAKVIGGEPERPTLVRKTIPAHVEATVLKALAKLPADRFATAADFAASLTGEKSAAPTYRGAPAGWRYAGVAVATAAVTLAVAFVLPARTGGAPPTYDIGFPDTAQMSFPSKMSEFSISPREDFVVYTVRQKNGTSIWRRDLADASAKAVSGTQGGVAPRVSPDGRLVAFVNAQALRIVPAEGGAARSLAEISDVVALEWISPRQLYVVDHDGNRVRFVDPESGQLTPRTVGYCIEPHWLSQTNQFLCGGGGQKSAFLVGSNADDTVHITLQSDAGGKGSRLAGSDFTLVDGRYLVYMSLDGDLRAAAYDPASHTAQRPVTLVAGIRREAYTGAGQYRVTPAGTLMYALGPNAEVARLVKGSRGKAPEPLPIEPAAFLRWDLSRDGRHLAAAVPVSDAMELRIYDLASGRMTVWFRAHDVGQPLWSPRGDRLVIDVSDSSGSAILAGSPQSGQPPDTITRLAFTRRQLEPHHFPSEHLVVLNAWDMDLIETFDPAVKPFHSDTIATGARFGALSPDERFLAYQSTASGEMIVLNRASKRKVQIAPSGWEPLWLSANEMIFRDTPGWYVAKLDPRTGDVIGKLEFWPLDPRFSETPGYSQRLSPGGGGIVYAQSPEPLTSAYLRVVPHWVDEMKRRVRASSR